MDYPFPDFRYVLAGAASAAGAEMVEEQILLHFRVMQPVPISTQRCPRRESKTGSRTFPASFATALLA